MDILVIFKFIEIIIWSDFYLNNEREAREGIKVSKSV